MAITSLHSNSSVNADGLLVYYGAGEATVTRGGEYSLFGGNHVTEVIIDLPSLDLVAGSNEMIVADNVTIPNGAMIDKVEVTVMEVTAGSSSTIDLGLIDQDRTTEIDFDGLLVNATTTWHTADIGTVVSYVQGTSQGGALVGTVLTNTGLITASADTADFTDGVLKVRIFWSVPLAADL